LIHTYTWINAAGEKCWVEYHFISDQGVQGLTGAEATKIAGEDADYHRRDLREAIGRGEFPSLTLSVQVMAYADAKDYQFNPFDLTKIWPHNDYPLIKVVTMTLNRNPKNFFAEIAQAAFSPGDTVPGIGFSPTRCCWVGRSPAPTATATGSAPTSTNCRSTVRTYPSTATCSTGR